MTDEELFSHVFDTDPDSSRFDTRYAGGVEALYHAVWMRENKGANEEMAFKAVERFMRDTIDWHEAKRWDFNPHPEWRAKVKLAFDYLDLVRPMPAGMKYEIRYQRNDSVDSFHLAWTDAMDTLDQLMGMIKWSQYRRVFAVDAEGKTVHEVTE